MRAMMPSNRKSHSFLLGMKNGPATLEDSLEAPYKVNIVLPHNPACMLLSIYPVELKLMSIQKTAHEYYL